MPLRRPRVLAGCQNRSNVLAWVRVVLLVLLPFAVKAQFLFVTNNGAIEITRYVGPGGAVVIPDSTNGLPVRQIGGNAFRSCSTVTSVAIPDSVVDIGSQAFYQCTGLARIAVPDSVTNISHQVFTYCTSLTNVAIGTGLATIGDQLFFLCTNLASFNVDSLNPAFSSLDGVLFDKTQSILIQYPAGKAGSYNIPPRVTTVRSNAFEYSLRLSDLTMPDSVKEIGSGAFFHCANLTSPVLPAQLTYVGDWAFQYCNALTIVAIPATVTNVGTAAFSACANLTAITVDGLNPVYSSSDGVLYDKTQSELIQYPGGKSGNYTVPKTVTRIGDYAGFGCWRLTGITFPLCLTSIGNYAFYNSALQQVVLPCITNIRHGAFDFCSALQRVVVPSSVTNIEDFAFANCGSLAEIYFRGNAPLAASNAFTGDSAATIYYLPDTTAWTATFAGRPTLLWNPIVRMDTSFGVNSNRFGFNITGTPNIPLVIEASTILDDPSWFSLKSCTLTNGLLYFSDPNWTNYVSRYYRLRSP